MSLGGRHSTPLKHVRSSSVLSSISKRGLRFLRSGRSRSVTRQRLPGITAKKDAERDSGDRGIGGSKKEEDTRTKGNKRGKVGNSKKRWKKPGTWGQKGNNRKRRSMTVTGKGTENLGWYNKSLVPQRFWENGWSVTEMEVPSKWQHREQKEAWDKSDNKCLWRWERQSLVLQKSHPKNLGKRKRQTLSSKYLLLSYARSISKI